MSWLQCISWSMILKSQRFTINQEESNSPTRATRSKSAFGIPLTFLFFGKRRPDGGNVRWRKRCFTWRKSNLIAIITTLTEPGLVLQQKHMPSRWASFTAFAHHEQTIGPIFATCAFSKSTCECHTLLSERMW